MQAQVVAGTSAMAGSLTWVLSSKKLGTAQASTARPATTRRSQRFPRLVRLRRFSVAAAAQRRFVRSPGRVDGVLLLCTVCSGSLQWGLEMRCADKRADCKSQWCFVKCRVLRDQRPRAAVAFNDSQCGSQVCLASQGGPGTTTPRVVVSAMSGRQTRLFARVELESQGL